MELIEVEYKQPAIKARCDVQDGSGKNIGFYEDPGDTYFRLYIYHPDQGKKLLGAFNKKVTSHQTLTAYANSQYDKLVRTDFWVL